MKIEIFDKRRVFSICRNFARCFCWAFCFLWFGFLIGREEKVENFYFNNLCVNFFLTMFIFVEKTQNTLKHKISDLLPHREVKDMSNVLPGYGPQTFLDVILVLYYYINGMYWDVI